MVMGGAIGIMIGTGVIWAIASTRIVLNVSSFDLLTYPGLVVFAGGVGVLASLLPARRATKTEPMTALRYE